MANPTPTARGTPAGIRLGNGFRTLITFENNPTLSLWEMAVQPPGVSGRDPVDTTTMHNIQLYTKAPRTLKEMTDMQFTSAYDPNVYNQLYSQINVETTITVTFPDGSTLAFYGYLQEFQPNELVEGEMPDAQCVIVCTNVDPDGNYVEEDPVLTSVAGT